MSNFTVSALKYRPQRFDEVIGQGHVSQTLKNALRSDHLAHAFLFCGPRGVGKTTCARILAKVLNCQQPVDEGTEPCNACSSCEAFNAHASFNITELDAASNNSVEHIRSLIEQVRFQPQQGKYKIFIIDEVHMLSQQAFNAFLKTLEEPPPYAIFILATTEKHKIIPTILSRCQIFDFRSISVSDMVSQLQAICEKEDVQAEEQALHIIAEKAGGALRDALSIYDRMLSFDNKQITYANVIEQLNVLDVEYYFSMTERLLAEDLSGVFMLLDEVIRAGFEPGIFLQGLASHMRQLLVAKDERTTALLPLSQSLKKRYLQQATLAPQPVLLTYLQLINQIEQQYKEAYDKRLHAEIGLMQLTYVNRLQEASLTANTEKKTADYASSSDIKPASTKKQIPAAPPKSDPTPIDSTIEETPTAYEPSLAEVPLAKEKAVPESQVQEQQPSSTLSLNRIVANLKADVNETDGSHTSLPLEIEQLQEAWQAYADDTESDYVRNHLSKSKLIISGVDSFSVQCPGNTYKHTIQAEHELIPFLKEKLSRSQLRMEVVVDKTLSKKKESDKVRKPVTDREKYQFIVQKNPAIQELKQKLDLRGE